MVQEKNESPLFNSRRKEIFLALVETQDQGISVNGSRKIIAERFEVSEDKVKRIEREGLDNDWPPL